MITDIVEINNFIVLIEQSNAEVALIQKCNLDDEVIGISFYVSGNVDLTVSFAAEEVSLHNSSGIVTSFYGNEKVSFIHLIDPVLPLRSISIFITLKNLLKLPKAEQGLFDIHLPNLVNPQGDFLIGPYFYMTPSLRTTVTKVFNNTYTGATRMMFLKSQVIELLTHFFERASSESDLSIEDQEKLFRAKEIILNNMEVPPSLSELSKMIGLNNYKLKKNFKELFGVPVFKYLQNERLEKAHSLISNGEMNVQQASLFVGYESLSSFSKAFIKKFGHRPSELKS